ncbi:MAG: hypothetical protein IPI12_08175 [Ignavibacteriales bacterium]|nr:hypothetical protein [Ignavibacteriales bacterium]
MNPMENLFNYITGDNILFSVVQGLLILFSFLTLLRTLSWKNQNCGWSTRVAKVSTDIRGFLFVGLVIFFTAVCFSTDEIIGHRIFWLTLDVGLLSYILLFNGWGRKRIDKV